MGLVLSLALVLLIWNTRLRRADRVRAQELEAKNAALLAEQNLHREASTKAQHLAQIFDATTDVAATCDPGGALQWMNPAGLQLLGLSKESIKGRRWQDLMPPEASDTLRTVAFPAAIAKGQWSGELALRAHDGRTVPVSQIVLAHKDSAGRVQFISTVARDITSVKAAEAQHREGRVRAELINAIATNINAGAEVPAVIRHVVRELAGFFPRYRVRFCSLTLGGACVVEEAMEPADMPSLHGLAFDLSLTPLYLAALRKDRPVAITDTSADTGLATAQGFYRAGRIGATLGQLVRTYDLLGVLSLDAQGPHEWTADEVATISEVCDYLTAAVTGARSVQERLHAEERLRVSEERLQVIINSMPVLAFAINPLGRIVFWNKEAQRVTGYTAIEISRPEGPEILLPDPAYRDRVLAEWSAPGGVRDFEWVIRCKDGQSRTLAWSSISQQSPIPGWKTWGIAIDITDRQRAEAWRTDQARVLEQLTADHALNTVLETLVLAIEKQETDLRCSILLLDDSDKLRMGVAPSLPSAYNAAVDGYPIGPANGSCGTAAYRRERVIVTDIAADPLWASVRELARAHGLAACWSQPIMGASGVLLGTFAMYYSVPRAPSQREVELIESAAHLAGIAITRRRDEQRLKERAEELSRSNAELERFAYVASHDLQEPLRMVTSFTQLLGQRYKGKLDKDADEFIGFAVEGAIRMQRLIEDLLAFSRVSSRPHKVERIPAENAVRWARGNLHAAITETNAQITSGDLPEVRVDEGQLGLVFQNLFANAIKFRRPGVVPEISVTARRAESAWSFEVKDNGIGIDAKHQDKIFTMFQRLHARSVYPGNGIGLAICKRILERHQGRIWVESTPGAGSTFHFTLPDVGTHA